MDELSLYQYQLPEELIALHPLKERDAARLLVVNRADGTLAHHQVKDLPRFLNAGDCLVLNDTKVLPARLLGYRTATGGKWEGLFLGTEADGTWRLIGQTRGRLLPGETLSIVPCSNQANAQILGRANPTTSNVSTQELELTLLSQNEEGTWRAAVRSDEDPLELLNRFGTMPLPPYLHRLVADEEDWLRYQTIYARAPGAIAAPTAGLHVTPQLLTRCMERQVRPLYVTLHVGIGTFRPVTASRLSEHQMHAEWCELSQEVATSINAAKQAGGRIVAVGTTSVRTLESAARTGPLTPYRGETSLFIRPGFRFQVVDGLLTNFHLPKSTLYVLVASLAGLELIRHAYAEAIKERYRFYSYGDAMLIL